MGKDLFVNCHSALLSSLTHFHAISPSQGLTKQESSLPAHQHWSLGLKSICCKQMAPLLKQPGYSLSLSAAPRDCMCRIWLLSSTQVHPPPPPPPILVHYSDTTTPQVHFQPKGFHLTKPQLIKAQTTLMSDNTDECNVGDHGDDVNYL